MQILHAAREQQSVTDSQSHIRVVHLFVLSHIEAAQQNPF